MTRILYLVVLLSVLFLCSAMLRNCRGIESKAQGESGLGRYLQTLWVDSVARSSAERLVVLVLYPADLGCMPCMLDFLDFCDTLQKALPAGSRIHGMMLVMRGGGSYASQRRKMAAWAMAGNIRLPLFLVDQDSLLQHHLSHTLVAVTDTSGEVELAADFPLPAETRNTILSRLSVK